MKCPICGQEMVLDSHRKIDLQMCYNCGYIEGRNIDGKAVAHVSNFQRLRSLDCNQCAAFLAKGLELDEQKVADWLSGIAE